MERNVRKNMTEKKVENVYFGLIEKNDRIIQTILKGVAKPHGTAFRLPGFSVLAYVTILVKASGWSLLEFLVFTLNFNLACGLEPAFRTS